MTKIITLFGFLISFLACANENKIEQPNETPIVKTEMEFADERVSLNLNAKQKNHQLQNMRSHLVAVQTLIELIAQEKYELAAKVAKTELGSSTEMQLMCASFGNENFEKLGLDFHASADKMSEVLKEKNQHKAMEALSLTMSFCISCHASYRQ